MKINTNKDYTNLYLLGIMILAASLRLLWLAQIPNGFYIDEASYAYDSYSILKTLRDQYGEFLPFYFRALNDYREGLYIYLSVPFIQIFGLNEFGARFTSALIGTLTVLVVYYLAKECFNQRVGLFAALFLAISPWHIQFSRIAFRAITVPLFLCLGLLFFVKSFKQPKYLPLAGLVFGIDAYTYSSAKLFVPVFVLGLIILFWQHLWKHKLASLLSLSLFLSIFIPILIFSFSSEGMARANAIGGIEDSFLKILENYSSYFGSRFLFTSGDTNLRHNPENIGELYPFEIVTVVLGIIYLIKNWNQNNKIFFLWLFLFPFPAALFSKVHAIRSIAGVPLFAILSACGTVQLIDFVKVKKRLVSLGLTIFILLTSLTILRQRYFIDYPRLQTRVWLEGLGKAITYADKSNYDCLVLSGNIVNAGEAVYPLIPFYTKFPPQEYQRLNIDFTTQRMDLGRWKIFDIDKREKIDESCLYIIDPDEIPALRKKGYSWKYIWSTGYFPLVEMKNPD